MQHCRTIYSKALLLSVMVHVAVVGSAIAFAHYGGTYFYGDLRSISVSLLVNPASGRSGKAARAKTNQGVSVPVKEAPINEMSSVLPKEGDIKQETFHDTDGGKGNEISGAGPQSMFPDGEGQGQGQGQGQQGDISLVQWQLVHSALEKVKTYPRVARERGVEGVVLVRFKVLPTGEIEKVDIIKSSGSDILDTASVRTVYRAAPMPYVHGWVEVPMSYVLK
jgi:TonB family protein